jgi:flagellar motility protein MotE (MotC chaperone)
MQSIAEMASQQKQQEMETWVTIYQAMPPQKVGEVIQGLDPDLALKLLAKMEPKKAGKILGFVSSDKAIELGKKLDNNH